MARAWGPQNWWPAESPLEVVVGAYLTQNTAWTNVEKAIANLRMADALSLPALRQIPVSELEQLIRPSGYFRQKAARIKTFISFLDATYGGSLEQMFAAPTEALREQLLRLNGVGKETADSILLYGGGHAIFPVDAYTRRIFHRHAVGEYFTAYDEVRSIAEAALDAEPGCGTLPAELRPRHAPSSMSRAQRTARAQHLNELHALLVRVGNQYCRKVPKCEECPLKTYLPIGGPVRLPQVRKAKAAVTEKTTSKLKR